ncbi:hypothetical protein UVI_02008190 [Ustilaginoidea virens]|uniref:Uncharacterized protein n=1 Tax=Ustilaginoidea virens TaxID=1159556 RepID=A0A1B5LAB1_USTVR|nr:hypothetical protein UVI_02008190 [Ustilaginoidea virens]
MLVGRASLSSAMKPSPAAAGPVICRRSPGEGGGRGAGIGPAGGSITMLGTLGRAAPFMMAGLPSLLVVVIRDACRVMRDAAVGDAAVGRQELDEPMGQPRDGLTGWQVAAATKEPVPSAAAAGSSPLATALETLASHRTAIAAGKLALQGSRSSWPVARPFSTGTINRLLAGSKVLSRHGPASLAVGHGQMKLELRLGNSAVPRLFAVLRGA